MVNNPDGAEGENGTMADHAQQDVASSKSSDDEMSGNFAEASDPTPEASPHLETETVKDTSDATPVRVVAIGASAGGLEPIEQFFDSMPIDSGFAFVIVQHLSPDFPSMMDQLLARHSAMKIQQAENGTRIVANHVYLNPPRTDLSISRGRLRAREQSNPEILGLPIDGFFRSLAEDQGDKAIGIILSGTGSDGTRGAQAIREAGGTVIVQDPHSAKFDSMPRSAMVRGSNTLTARPNEMPDLIKALAKGERVLPAGLNGEKSNDPEQVIISLLEKRYGADFGYYKRSTVGRRVRRRSHLNNIQTLELYAEHLADNADELEALYCDLLIGVTSFFRDGEVFDIIDEKILPVLASTMSEKRQLRIWVPGCASGEEAYSLAILISEFAKTRGMTPNLKIFATDIHFNSLEFASSGYYDEDSVKSIPKNLLAEYFERVDNRYHVRKKLRQQVIFSAHNLLKDPPFTRMDLVSCRNLLIYFDEIAQKKVLALFHYALRKDGVLVLGPSETTGELANEFDTVDKRWRIYRKTRDVRLRESTNLLPLSSREALDSEDGNQLHNKKLVAVPTNTGAIERELLSRACDRVLEKYAPSCLLIDRTGHLIYVFGNADKFLVVSHGLFSRKLTDLLHNDLKLTVNAGLERTVAQQTIPFHRKTKVTLNDGSEVIVSVEVERLSAQRSYADYLLVTLDEKENPVELPKPDDVDSPDSERTFFGHRIAELEQDLKVTEESLQTSIEELEVSNEELQATNEELMASNEELQSTNEELHSVNEELYTVSAEYQLKIEEMTQLTDDIDNLLRATEIGTIFLDPTLRIRRFTPKAAQAFNLVAHDIGRPFEHITYRFSYEGLAGEIAAVQQNGSTVNQEVTIDGHAYLLRILAYENDWDGNAGVVITIVDVQELKEAQRRLARQEEDRGFRQLYQRTPIIMYSFDKIGTILGTNQHWLDVLGYDSDAVVGRNIADFHVDQTGRESVHEMLASLREVGSCKDKPCQMLRKDGSVIDARMSAIVVQDLKNGQHPILAVVEDINDQRYAEKSLEKKSSDLGLANNALQQVKTSLGDALNDPLSNIKKTASTMSDRASIVAPPELKRDIDQLLEHVERLDDMISNAIDQAQANTNATATGSIDIARAFKDVFDTVRKPDGMDLIVKSAPDQMLTDREPLMSIFRHVIEYAAKHIDGARNSRIVVEVADLEASWSFAIEDDGPGIDPCYHDAILEPFSDRNGAGSTMRSLIGLVLASLEIKANGGTVELFSNPLEAPGSRFVFTWPKKQAQAAAAE